MDSKLKIYVSTYRKKVYSKSKKIYIPLEVGIDSRLDEKSPIYSTLDNSGDNISNLNPIYGELTGLYWIWKNTNSCYVGFYHYNKYLKINPLDAINYLDSNDGFIVAKKHFMKNHSNIEHYEIFLNLLKDYNYEFYELYTSLLIENGTGTISGMNMFITNRKNLNDFCSFLFPLLDKLYNEIGDINTDAYHKRYCAFLAERLLTPYLIYNNIKYLEVPYYYTGSIFHQIFIKIYFLIKPLLSKDLSEFLFKYVRNSSYT